MYKLLVLNRNILYYITVQPKDYRQIKKMSKTKLQWNVEKNIILILIQPLLMN